MDHKPLLPATRSRSFGRFYRFSYNTLSFRSKKRIFCRFRRIQSNRFHLSGIVQFVARADKGGFTKGASKGEQGISKAMFPHIRVGIGRYWRAEQGQPYAAAFGIVAVFAVVKECNASTLFLKTDPLRF